MASKQYWVRLTDEPAKRVDRIQKELLRTPHLRPLLEGGADAKTARMLVEAGIPVIEKMLGIDYETEQAILRKAAQGEAEREATIELNIDLSPAGEQRAVIKVRANLDETWAAVYRRVFKAAGLQPPFDRWELQTPEGETFPLTSTLEEIRPVSGVVLNIARTLPVPLDPYQRALPNDAAAVGLGAEDSVKLQSETEDVGLHRERPSKA